MKITLNVDSELLGRAVKSTGATTNTAAIEYALGELDRQARRTEGLSTSTGSDLPNTSEHKQVEEKLKESEERFKSIVDQSPLSIQMFTPDGMTEQINRAYENLWGITINDLNGYNILEDQQLVSLGIMPYIQGAFSGKSASIPAAEFDTVKSLGIGKKMWIKARIYPLKNSGGIIDKVILIHEDITERKRAQAALQESEERFSSAFNKSPIPLVITDIETGARIAVNDRFVESFGYSRAQFLNDNLYKTQLAADKSALREIIAQIKRDGFLQNYRLQMVTKNGDIREVLISAARIGQKNKNQFIVSHLDITDQKKAENELIKAKEKAETSDRLKSAFLANTSHEIRTPLNAIVNFSRMLTWEDPVSNEEKKEYADIVESNSTSLLNLIDDILDISKIESGNLEMRKATVDLRVLLSDLSVAYEKSSKRNPNVEIRLVLPDDQAAIKLHTDENRLKQVLINLVDNALKFTELGHLTIGATLEGDQVNIYIEDTGIGISKEDQAAIFERFYKIDSNAKKLYRGVGLGLAISSKIIELLDGKLNVDSELGRGSKFFFSLPLTVEKDESPHSARPKEGIKNRSALTGLKLLLVEDEPTNMHVLQILLRDTGAKFEEACSGEDAVKLYKETLPDLVLMDIKLPGIDGYEAAQRILEINSEAIIVAQSAFAGTDDQEKATALGFAGFVTKPIAREQLIKSIEQAMV